MARPPSAAPPLPAGPQDGLASGAREDAPERAYAAEADPAHRRRHAQFFTPFSLASFMARWVLDGPRTSALADPALGLGVFVRAVAGESRGTHRLAGFEIDPALADRAEALLAGLPERIAHTIHRRDYLESDWDARYDGILCNPPYLRFQEYAGREARLQSLEDRMGVRLAGLTNLHCLFLLKAVHQLAEEGRAAFVMPWEFLNAGYGERIKAYLLGAGVLRHAVVFDSARGIFPGAVTTACVLLMGRDGDAREVAFHRATAGQDLGALYRDAIAPRGRGLPGRPPGPAPGPAGSKVIPVAGLDAGAKWRGYWKVTSDAKYRNMVPLGSFATVLRGIATGNNDFFTLDSAERETAGLPADCLLPCVTKTRDVSHPVFRDRDFAALEARGRPVWLLDAEGSGHPAVAAYLESGLAAGVHERFLTRHRSPWYALEKRPPSPLWVSVFNRGGGIKPVLNRAGARNLTAFHCVYPKPGAEEWMDILFAWLLTDPASALVRENGREYGAGLEKIEPRDLAGAPVPDFARMGAADLGELRAMVEELASGHRVPGDRRIEEIFRSYI